MQHTIQRELNLIFPDNQLYFSAIKDYCITKSSLETDSFIWGLEGV